MTKRIGKLKNLEKLAKIELEEGGEFIVSDEKPK